MKTDIKTLLAVLLLLLPLGAKAAGSADNEFMTSRAVFTWGASAGASIDMSSNDMSTVDFDITLGFRRGWINFLGLGLGADIMVSNSCRTFPLYAELRTNFLNHPTIGFWDFKAGMALNYLEHNHQQTGVYAFTGPGFNLARSRKFNSYILIGYTFVQRRPINGPEMYHDFGSLHYATVKIGVSF